VIDPNRLSGLVNLRSGERARLGGAEFGVIAAHRAPQRSNTCVSSV